MSLEVFSMTAPISIDFANVQALIVQGYTVSCSRHLLFEFTDAAGARAFIATLVQRGITSAKIWTENKPSVALNVSLSFAGLQAAAALMPNAERIPIGFPRRPQSDSHA